MKNPLDILDLKTKKSLRLGLLLLSTPAIIVVLVFSVFVISLSLFGFLREAFKRKASAETASSPTDLESMPPVEMDLGRNSDEKSEETEYSLSSE